MIHNFELSSVKQGTFSSDPDEFYIEKFHLPRRAIDSGSDLRRLTVREMLGVFAALRGRHFSDVGNPDRADRDYALSRVLFPQHRRSYIRAMVPALRRGAKLFDQGELGHPNSLFRDLAPTFGIEYSEPTYPQGVSLIHVPFLRAHAVDGLPKSMTGRGSRKG